MFKIVKGSQEDTYSVSCYNYISECNFYTFLYSAKDISLDTLASLLQGRMKDIGDLEWVPDIVKYTNQPAIIGTDGSLRAVPLYQERDLYDESTRTSGRVIQT